MDALVCDSNTVVIHERDKLWMPTLNPTLTHVKLLIANLSTETTIFFIPFLIVGNKVSISAGNCFCAVGPSPPASHKALDQVWV